MKKNLLKNIFSLIVLIIVVLACIELFILDILPTKYLILFLGLEILVFAIGLILYNRKSKILLVLGIIIYLFSMFGNFIGYYSLNKVNKYISTTLQKGYYTINTTYYVVADKNNNVNQLSDISKDSNILYYKYSRSIDNALKKLGDYKYKDTDTASGALSSIANTNDYFLIAKANYDYFFSSNNINLVNKDNYKIVHQFDVEEKIPVNNEVKDTYNIYLNGLDFTGIMRDYNLIITVNIKTHKVLLTSIPRDYYIDVPAYNMKDTLMCLGSLDSEVSKEALEKLFDTEIDYTINLNTTSLVDIVDSIGGIEFCSDYEFTTNHSLVLDTYNDKTGKKLHVTKGCKTYNGIETLAIARERKNLPAGDRDRQKNCRQILVNIVKKLGSTLSANNYNEILKSFDGLYTTDINEKVLKQLIKAYLDNPNFEILEQSVNGSDSIGIGHLGTQEAWICTPDMNTVNPAIQKIKEVLNEK